MSASKKPLIASIALTIVGIVWGTTYAINKEALEFVSPLSMLMYRFVLSAILLSLFYAKKLTKVTLGEVKTGFKIGIFLFLAMFFTTVGAVFTTASKQSFIIGSYILYVPLLAFIINKIKPDKYAIIAVCMATAGLGLLTVEKNTSFNIGDTFSVLSSIFFALHIIVVERYSNKIDPIISTLMQFLTIAIFSIILVAIYEGFDFSILWKMKYTFAYIVIFTTTLPFVVQNIAQKYISSTSTSVILVLESVFGSIFAIFYLNEKMSLQMFLGSVIILLAVMTQQTKWRLNLRRI